LRAGSLAALAVAGAVGGAGGVGASMLIEEAVPEASGGGRITVPGVGTISVPGAPGRPDQGTPSPPAEVKAGSSRSLYRRSNFSRALRQTRRHGTRFTLLRLDPARLQMQIRSRGGGRYVIVEATGGSRTIDLPTTPRQSMSVTRIDPVVPERLLAGLRRKGVRPSEVDYMVVSISPIDGSGQWGAYLDGGRHYYRAGLDGGGLQRVL
jgi:hypothetical protein